MIRLADPYWRRLLAIAAVGTLLAAAVALVAMPLQSGSGDDRAGSSGSAHGFHVSAVTLSPGPQAGIVELSVDVSNDEGGLVEDLTARVEDVTLAPASDTVAGFVGRVGLTGPGQHGSQTHPFDVVAAEGVDLSLRATSVSPAGGLSLEVVAPSGKKWTAQGSGTAKALSLGVEDITAGGEGSYQAVVAHAGGLRAISYNLTATVRHIPSSEDLTWSELATGESHTFRWLVEDGENVTAARVLVGGTFVAPGGEPMSYEYAAGVETPAVEVSDTPPGAWFTSGEALGFVAVTVLSVAVLSGLLRARGGRAQSQVRSRRSVWVHRVAYLTMLGVVTAHGLVQLAAGHYDDLLTVGMVGTAAFAGMVALLWFNAYRRDLVASMSWNVWLALKVVAVLSVVALIAVHVLLFGRHFIA